MSLTPVRVWQEDALSMAKRKFAHIETKEKVKDKIPGHRVSWRGEGAERSSKRERARGSCADERARERGRETEGQKEEAEEEREEAGA